MIRLPLLLAIFGLFLATLKVVETSDLDSKTVQKITLKSRNKKGAGSADAFKGEVCGIKGQCCKFSIPKYSIGQNGKRILTGNSLGECKTLPIYPRVVMVTLEKPGSDTFLGEYIEVITKTKSGETEIQLCPINVSLRSSKISFDCNPTKLSSKTKSIEKVTVKTQNHIHAASENPMVGKICGLNGKCCTFNVPESSFEKGGINDFESVKLGDCQVFPINSNVKSVEIEKTGDDTWIGDFIEVTSRQGTNDFEVHHCPINYWLRNNGKRTFYCIPKNLLSKAKKIKSILVKTKDRSYAASSDAFEGEACGINGQCCGFSIKEKALDVRGGELYLSSDNLGGCKDFPVYPNVKSIMLKKIGDDTWIGDFIEVFTTDHQFCDANNVWIRTNGKATFSCTTCLNQGTF